MSTTDKPVPTVPFPRIARRVAQYWDPYEWNPHKGLFAPAGGGKSYLIRHGLLPIVPGARTVVIDVKPGGERTWNGWGTDVISLSPGFAPGNYRVMVRPGDEGKRQVRHILELIAAEGECIVIMDDSKRITAQAPNMGLAGWVNKLLDECRSIGVSVILAANSTNWVTSSLRDQCSVYFLGLMRNELERKKLSEIIGLPREYRHALATIKPHQFLYSDQFDGDIKVAITGIS